MSKIEIIELFNKNNIDTVGIAPIGPYEELKKVLEDKVNKNLITGMEEPDIEKRINPKYVAYENMIAGYINKQYDGEVIEEDLITVMKLYFPNKRMGDLHNYPKSICDGIEKSGIIKNDKQLKPVLLFDFIDKENPRVEIELYPVSQYNITYDIIPKYF